MECNKLMIIILVFVIVNTKNCFGIPYPLQNSKNICKTSACVNSASTMIHYMDNRVNPCDDFYKFTCGNFVKNAVINNEESSNNSISMIRHKVKEQLKSSLETIDLKKEPEVIKKLKFYYDVCMNEDFTKANIDAELRSIFNKLGRWPIMVGKSWNSLNFNWLQTAYKFQTEGFSSDFFFKVNIEVDMKNNSRRLIFLNNPGFGVSTEFLTRNSESKIRSSYFELMVKVATVFGCNKTEAQKELKEILKLKANLAKICLTSIEERDPQNMYNPMTVTELQKKFPYIPWLTYINNMFSPYKVLKSNDTIILGGKKYFQKLNDILVKTPKRVLANFIYWRVIMQSIDFLSKPIRDAFGKFNSEMKGLKTNTLKWITCLSHANSKLPLATGSLYVRSHFDKTKKQKMINIHKDVHNTFDQILNKVDWMDEVTKKAALKKLHHMKPLIAYPDELLSNIKLNDYYKDLKIDLKSLLKTELNFNKFMLKKSVELLKEPVKRFDWRENSASTVNAFYSPMQNSIELPSGILQHPLFDAENPRYMNFAGIGMVVGHEISHGFDDVGRQFSFDGKFYDWWHSETKKKFLEKARCIIEQYSNYTSEEVGIKLNGELSLGENIADDGGVKIAYNAYDEWQKANPEEPRLPGLESYTPKQLFWISFAHTWCAKYRPEYQKYLILTDTHSVARYRVIGTISNRPEFSEDFHCPRGSPMNPVSKCSVW